MRLSASFMDTAGGELMDTAGGDAMGAGVETGADCCGRAVGGACARATGEKPNAAPAKPIAVANMAPNRHAPPASCAGQSRVDLHAQPTGAVARLDRLNSAPTASRKPQLAVFTQ